MHPGLSRDGPEEAEDESGCLTARLRALTAQGNLQCLILQERAVGKVLAGRLELQLGLCPPELHKG